MKKTFFSAEASQKIIAAIRQAESVSSAEIRVHVERRSLQNPIKRGIAVFHKLKMDQTKLRNGVLLYLSVKNHKFAVLGDKGIHEGVPADFWDKLAADVTSFLQNDSLVDGICASISLLGTALSQYFPRQADDVNELDDEISIGDE
jgi:uncharacterized membrane protein